MEHTVDATTRIEGNVEFDQLFAQVQPAAFVPQYAFWNPPTAAGLSNRVEQQQEIGMTNKQTVIVTGALQGIGAAVTQTLLDRGYSVVGNSRSFSGSNLTPSTNLVLVEGDIGLAATAEKIAHTAIEKFGSIDHVVSSAGIFSAKPFTDYTEDESRAFVSTRLEGFIFITQLAVRHILCAGHRRQRNVRFCIAGRHSYCRHSGLPS